ncbi:hypothetical protein D3C80_1946840 [compost metagenome]
MPFFEINIPVILKRIIPVGLNTILMQLFDQRNDKGGAVYDLVINDAHFNTRLCFLFQQCKELFGRLVFHKREGYQVYA